MAREHHASHDAPPGDERHDDIDAQARALRERARQLGATAEELEAALDALSLQAEVVLHRLRGGRVH